MYVMILKDGMVADHLISPIVFIHFRLQIVSCDYNITTSVKK